MIGTLILALLLLFLAYRGWQRGIVRQGLSLFALAVAIGVGTWVYQGGFPADFLGIPRALGGKAFFLGWSAYVAIMIPASILFKKTGQQAGIIRFLYGIGGAVCGVIWGIFLWGLVFSPTGLPKIGSFLQKPSVYSANRNARVAAFEESADSLYETFRKISRVTTDQRLMARFFQYPDIRKVIEARAVSELMKNPQIADAVARRNVIGLLSNPKLYQALRDPEVERAIQTAHFKKALDYALSR